MQGIWIQKQASFMYEPAGASNYTYRRRKMGVEVGDQREKSSHYPVKNVIEGKNGEGK